MVEIAIQNSKALHTPGCHRAEDVGSRYEFKDKEVVSQVGGGGGSSHALMKTFQVKDLTEAHRMKKVTAPITCLSEEESPHISPLCTVRH